MADFSKPAMGGNYTLNYNDIKANTNAVAAMFKGVTNPQNLPQYSVKLDNGVLQRWNGSSWIGEQIQIQSGGTGASTAAGARTNLSVYSKLEIDALESAVQSQIDGNDTDISNLQTAVSSNDTDISNLQTTKADKSVTLTATTPLTGGGDLSASRSFGIQDASTTQKGAVQLNNTLTSTSTTQALTAAQGKALSDSISSAVNTSNVLSAIAGASAGAVGTYAFARSTVASDVGFGGTIAGSSLVPTSAMYRKGSAFANDVSFASGAALAGTWRAVGYYDYAGTTSGETMYGATVWLRIA